MSEYEWPGRNDYSPIQDVLDCSGWFGLAFVMPWRPHVLLRIDYDEGDQSSYRGVVMSIHDASLRYMSGDPVKDSREAIKAVTLAGFPVICSSSYDHFVTDGDKFGWIEDENGKAWMVEVKEKDA